MNVSLYDIPQGEEPPPPSPPGFGLPVSTSFPQPPAEVRAVPSMLQDISGSGDSISSTHHQDLTNEERDNIYWRNRCESLEASLMKFKQKAARIRELLTDKMKATEQEVKEANQRAQAAEEKCKQLEELALSSPVRMTAEQELIELMRIREEENMLIQQLHHQINNLMEQKRKDSLLIEEKSAKIRDWVCRKFEEMDAYSSELERDNEELRREVEGLRVREGGRIPYPDLVVHDSTRSTAQDACQSTNDISSSNSNSTNQKDIPIYATPIKRALPSSTVTDSSHSTSKVTSGRSLGNGNGSVENTSDTEEEKLKRKSDVNKFLSGVRSDSLRSDCQRVGGLSRSASYSKDYEELDKLLEYGMTGGAGDAGRQGDAMGSEQQESGVDQGRRPSCAPPVLHIERKIFPNLLIPRSPSNISSSNDSRDALEDFDIDKPKKKKKSEELGDLDRSAIERDRYMERGKDGGQKAVNEKASSMVSALVTMPRKGKEGGGGWGMREGGLIDARYCSLTLDRKREIRSGHRIGSGQITMRPKPPTPPMRRVPSWEKRIYSAVSESDFTFPQSSSDLGSSNDSASCELVSRSSVLPIVAEKSSRRVSYYVMLNGMAVRLHNPSITDQHSSSSSSSEQPSSSEDETHQVTNSTQHSTAMTTAVCQKFGKSSGSGSMMVRVKPSTSAAVDRYSLSNKSNTILNGSGKSMGYSKQDITRGKGSDKKADIVGSRLSGKADNIRSSCDDRSNNFASSSSTIGKLPIHEERASSSSRDSKRTLTHENVDSKTKTTNTVGSESTGFNGNRIDDDEDDDDDDDYKHLVMHSSSGMNGKIDNNDEDDNYDDDEVRVFHDGVSDTSSDYAVPPDEDATSVRSDTSDEPKNSTTVGNFAVHGNTAVSTASFQERDMKLSAESHQLIALSIEQNKLSVRCGHVLRSSGASGIWNKIWCDVRQDGWLVYTKNLESCSNDTVNKMKKIPLDVNTTLIRHGKSVVFEIRTKERNHLMAAESPRETRHWIRAMRSVMYGGLGECKPATSKSKEPLSTWLIRVRNGRRRHLWCTLVSRSLQFFHNPAENSSSAALKPLEEIDLRECRVEEVTDTDIITSDSDSSSIDDDDDITLDDDDDECRKSRYIISVLPLNQSPTYLIIPARYNKENWMYHLVVASGGCDLKSLATPTCTDYEQKIFKLMNCEGESNSAYWRDPVLLYNKEPITKPLTSLHNDDLCKKALELYKMCQNFMYTTLDVNNPEYHIKIAQQIFTLILAHEPLRNELFAQLIKFTSRHPQQSKSSSGVQSFLLCGSHSWFGHCDGSSPTSPTNSSYLCDVSTNGCSGGRDSKLNPSHFALLQAWQLLTLAISLVLPPKPSLVWYLRTHLQRSTDSRTEVGKYAVFCQCCMDRVCSNGSRKLRPSRMEILSIMLRHPFHHSQPISIPVHFLNGSYQVVSFDGSTTVDEFIQTLNRSINIRQGNHSGFALYSDLVQNENELFCLKPHQKLADVISQWEQNYIDSNISDKSSAFRLIRLTYKNRLHITQCRRGETEKERLLLVYQAHSAVMSSLLPLTESLALELAALMAQIEYGDFRPAAMSDGTAGTADSSHQAQQLFDGQYDTISKSSTAQLISCSTTESIGLAASVGLGTSAGLGPTPSVSQILEKYLAPGFISKSPQSSHSTPQHCGADQKKKIESERKQVLEQSLTEKWSRLRGHGTVECSRVYLNVVRQWKHFGATLYPATVKHGPNGSSKNISKLFSADDTISSTVIHGRKILLSVSEHGVSILYYHTLKSILDIPYKSVISFGEYKQDLMIVVKIEVETSKRNRASSKQQKTSAKKQKRTRKSQRTIRLVFSLTQHLKEDLISVMYDYISTLHLKPAPSPHHSLASTYDPRLTSDHHPDPRLTSNLHSDPSSFSLPLSLIRGQQRRSSSLLSHQQPKQQQ